jgi:hypothetical protein
VSLTRKKGNIDEADIAVVYNQLKPVPLETILGEWTGGDFENAHPGHKALLNARWAGKDFHSEEEVDPIMVYDDSGKRVWNKDFGHAKVGVLFLNDVFHSMPSDLKAAARGEIPRCYLDCYDI